MTCERTDAVGAKTINELLSYGEGKPSSETCVVGLESGFPARRQISQR